MGSLGPQHVDFEVPTIDLSAYLQDPNTPEADAVVEQIRNACATSGFFQLTGHGIPKALQQQAFAASRSLFNLSDEEKLKLCSKPGRGYEVMGKQFLEPGKQPDLKEGYFIGREISNATPPFRPFQEPNVWPSPDLIPESQFKIPLLEYYRSVSDLSFVIMKILASGLRHSNLDTSVFTEFCHEPISSVRLLHYPPHPDTQDDSLVGTGAHTDFGAITLLLQDGNSGLQVLNQDTNEWLDVEPREDAYVVNIGDMLDVWTSGAYKSTVHRVINTSGGERYSIPFFLDGNADCVIKPLGGDSMGTGAGAGNVKKPFTVEEHMLSRYAASYK
ncbi:hypothetical protein PV08_11634 [Exophiala spinifera]|uniref:Fe2OG dioxygenase domain-containing protein n=1 Tax=Exophiala spinifera TaxID=91928 RepID=A0A0D2AW26_9EURO|nr:uncharacterized protein PV08_11634 [Exophiala spinifera]KIW10670.1 hypothetical protein PV08_11634 [Exophiala spinifera]